MTLTTLFNKNFMPILRWEIKRLLVWMILFPFLAFVFTLGVGYSIATVNYTGNVRIEDRVTTTAVVSDITAQVSYMQLVVIMLVLLVVSAFFAVYQYGSLYSKRKTDFFQALPVTRQTTYLTRTLAAALVIVLTYVAAGIGVLLLNTIIPARYYAYVNTGYCLRAIAVGLVASLAFYCIAQLCAVTSGKVWQYWTLLLGIGFYIPFGILAFLSLIPAFLPGMPQSAVNAGALCSPVFAVFLAASHLFRFRVLLCCSLLIGLAAYMAGAYLYARRSNECAEQTVSTGVVSTLATFGAALCTVTLPGLLLLKENMYLLYALLAVLAMVGVSVICTLIYHHKAFTKATGIQLCVLSVAVFGLIALLGTDAFGYREAVPDTQEVESVSVTLDYEDKAAVSSSFWLDPTDFETDGREAESYVFTDAESIQDMLNLQKRCIQKEKSDPIQSGSFSFRLDYKLKDGASLERVYHLNADTDYMYAVYAAKGCKLLQPFIKDVALKDVRFISFNQSAEEDNTYISKAEAGVCLVDPKTYYPAIVSDYMSLNETEMASAGDYNYGTGRNTVTFDMLIIKPDVDASTRAKLEKMLYTDMIALYYKYDPYSTSDTKADECPVLLETVSLPVQMEDGGKTVALLRKDKLLAHTLETAPAAADVQMMLVAPIYYDAVWNEIHFGEGDEDYLPLARAGDFLGMPVVLKDYEKTYAELFRVLQTDTEQGRSSVETVLSQVQDDADQVQLFEQNDKAGFAVFFKTKSGAYSKMYYVKTVAGYEGMPLAE